MEFMSREDLFDRYPGKMLYVGFLKSGDTWFPLSSISDPDKENKLDTLLVSPAYPLMHELVTGYSKRLRQIEDHFVHLLMHEEISNVMESYGLKKVALATIGGDGDGCSCGCGCS